jgi:hypothetical protein
MNKPESLPDYDATEREWQLQELARDDERQGRDSTEQSARRLRYRLLARALNQPLETQPSTDFVHCAVAGIEAAAMLRRRATRRFEIGLIVFFAAVFGACTLLAFTVFSGDWDAVLTSTPVLDLAGNPWLLTLLGCMGLSRLLDGRGDKNRRRHAAL